jgi:hypothetical protein
VRSTYGGKQKNGEGFVTGQRSTMLEMSVDGVWTLKITGSCWIHRFTGQLNYEKGFYFNYLQFIWHKLWPTLTVALIQFCVTLFVTVILCWHLWSGNSDVKTVPCTGRCSHQLGHIHIAKAACKIFTTAVRLAFAKTYQHTGVLKFWASGHPKFFMMVPIIFFLIY